MWNEVQSPGLVSMIINFMWGEAPFAVLLSSFGPDSKLVEDRLSNVCHFQGSSKRVLNKDGKITQYSLFSFSFSS